jgi:GT2 family glycosyltransferase
MAGSTEQRITIVVTQRERMSASEETLEALYENISIPFDLIYVVGHVSGRRRRWLQSRVAKRGFRLLEAGRALTPAEARNLGAAHAKTEFVLFIENDVVPLRGWAELLLACADETGADGVVPMTCEGRPLHTMVHHVGDRDDAAPGADGADAGKRTYDETFHLQGQDRSIAAQRLQRRQTATCEMHCLLVRRAALERLGGFDPHIVSKEHLDFSWRLAREGFRLWLEPQAVVTFLVPSENDPIRWSDLPYFLLRWSPAWQKQSHDILKERWGLQEEGYIASRRQLSGWRIVDHALKPAIRGIPLVGKRWGAVERLSKLSYPAAALIADMQARRWRRKRERTPGDSSGSAGV